MARFLVQFLFAIAGFWAAQAFVPGIEVHGWTSLVIAALLLGIANAIVRPILVVLTFPVVFITFGLFLLVINAGMLLLTGWIAEQLDLGFVVDGFWPAVWGAIVITVVTWLVDGLIGPDRDR